MEPIHQANIPGVGLRKYYSAQGYSYPTDPAVVICSAAAPNPQAQIRIETDSDFECSYIGLAADIAAAAQTSSTIVVPLATLFILQSGGNPMMAGPVPLSLFSGDGKLPFILPEPITLPANSALTLQFARYAAAVDYNLRLVLIGRKLYLE